ncbi:MAG: metalloregulator ArsR/SmtB family transcription factor [Alphaproteobacteria bacterium]|nr:metalloregulator ArsR/SmtB family transcription factor [Alphaproteobacteria bacterium]
MTQSIKILAALAEPTRFEVIRILWDGREHCVCELMEALGKSQSCMSRHMTSLKNAGLVVDRRDAQWVRYRRSPELSKAITSLVEAALALDKPLKRKSA